MATNLEVIHAYRHLYRNLLKAVQYTMPARFIARRQIRSAFREKGAEYDAEGIKRTIWFLEAAAKEKGLEHLILKNLLRVKAEKDAKVKSWRHNLAEEKKKKDAMDEHRKTAWRHYDMTIAMLNKTMGLCLR